MWKIYVIENRPNQFIISLFYHKRTAHYTEKKKKLNTVQKWSKPSKTKFVNLTQHEINQARLLTQKVQSLQRAGLQAVHLGTCATPGEWIEVDVTLVVKKLSEFFRGYFLVRPVCFEGEAYRYKYWYRYINNRFRKKYFKNLHRPTFNVPINTLRRVVPVNNHLYWYWQPNKNNQATEDTNNIKITQPKKSP